MRGVEQQQELLVACILCISRVYLCVYIYLYIIMCVCTEIVFVSERMLSQRLFLNFLRYS